MKSWDVSVQALNQGKFGEPLGTHRLYSSYLSHPEPVCELDGGRMIFQYTHESSSSERKLFVFGPHPTPTSAKSEAAAITVEENENSMERKRRRVA